jgi:hypothetical protein
MHVNITRPKRIAGSSEEAVGHTFYRRCPGRRWWSWLWKEARYTSGFSSVRSDEFILRQDVPRA